MPAKPWLCALAEFSSYHSFVVMSRLCRGLERLAGPRVPNEFLDVDPAQERRTVTVAATRALRTRTCPTLRRSRRISRAALGPGTCRSIALTHFQCAVVSDDRFQISTPWFRTFPSTCSTSILNRGTPSRRVAQFTRLDTGTQIAPTITTARTTPWRIRITRSSPAYQHFRHRRHSVNGDVTSASTRQTFARSHYLRKHHAFADPSINTSRSIISPTIVPEFNPTWVTLSSAADCLRSTGNTAGDARRKNRPRTRQLAAIVYVGLSHA